MSTNPEAHPDRIAVLALKDLPSVGTELNEVFLGHNMGNKESKDAAVHAQHVAMKAHAPTTADHAEHTERVKMARAKEQGGRWLDQGEEPHGAASQVQQPEVKAAMLAAQRLDVQEREEQKEKARHLSTAGRF